MLRFKRSSWTRLRAWMRSRVGSIAISTAAMAVPMVLLVGASVNFARAELGKEKLQAAIDSAALTLTKTTNRELNPDQIIRAYIDANMKSSIVDPADITYTYQLTDGVNGRGIDIRATAKADLVFSNLYKFDDIEFTVQSKAFFAFRRIEIAMVLDVSGSMNGSKIRNLRDAAVEFLDIALPDDVVELTRISILPYGGGVQLPPEFGRFMDSSRVDPTNWSGCAVLPNDTMDDDLLTLDTYREIPTYWTHSNRNNTTSSPNRRRSHCVPNTEAVFLSNDRVSMQTFIRSFGAAGLGDSTGTDFGVAWGFKALSPNWRGEFPGAPAGLPADFRDDETMKIMIVMTDGEITNVRVPLANDVTQYQNIRNRKNGERNFTSVCDQAKTEGIVVYSIGFELKNSRTLNLLRDCASSNANFFEAEGAEISEVFSFIARQLSALRLTQ